MQGYLYDSYAMRHPEMRLLWQALFVAVAFEISFVVTLMFVAAGAGGGGGGSPTTQSSTEAMLLALVTNYVVTLAEYLRLHAFLGGPVGYGQLATALNISWLALGLGAISVFPAAWYIEVRQSAGRAASKTDIWIAVAIGLAVTLLTSVFPFELLIRLDAPA